MTLARPYRRTCRQLADGSYANGGNGRYVTHPAYAKSPEHYVRAFQIIQRDLEELFDYVEPSDQNLSCHSFRIHELLMRACIEVEANCKAILTANEAALGNSPDMRDFRKVEASHKLSGYEIIAPTWHGERAKRKPFASWANPPGEQTLPWYDAYNNTKHNRATRFHEATFEHMLDAVCGLVVLLSAQFRNEDFSNTNLVSFAAAPRVGELAIGGYFLVSFPEWPEAERYEFDWRELGNEVDPFINFPYP